MRGTIIAYFVIPILLFVCAAADNICNQTSANSVGGIGNDDESLDTFDIDKILPFYFSGFDFDNIPILVIEVGHWDVFRVSQNTKEYADEIERWNTQFYGCMEQISNSTTVNIDGDEVPVDEFVLILDFEGFNLKMMSTSQSASLMLKLWKGFKHHDNAVAYGFYINMNAVAENFVSLTKSLASKALGRSEFFGSRKQSWIPALYRKIPRNQLAPWYGGDNECFEAKYGKCLI